MFQAQTMTTHQTPMHPRAARLVKLTLARRCLSVGVLMVACVWSHATEAPRQDLSSWVEVIASACGKKCGFQLNVEGVAGPDQRIKLLQQDLVFMEQKLPAGPFNIRAIRPLKNNMPVQIVLESADKTVDEVQLPMQANEKRILFAKFTPPPSTPPSAAAAASKALKTPEPEDDLEFDTDFLRGKAFRSLDPLEVKRLGLARPGTYDADIFRNGGPVTKTPLLLIADPLKADAPAKACITPALFSQLGTKPQAITAKGLALIKAQQQVETKPNCMPIDDWIDGASAEFEASELRLDISIPQAFLNKQNYQSVPKELLVRGVDAGFVNYTLNGFNSGSQTSQFLGLRGGVNFSGWQLRQSATYSQNNGTGSQFIVGETVVNRPLLDLNANLAIGDTGTFSPVIGSTAIRGVRLSSEESLYPEEERSFRPVIRGVARTNARVRVSQNNTVFFEQNVPPGPFEFNDLNPISTVGNLQVLVSEADGTEQRFVVPYSFSAGKLNPGSWRYSVATGVYRNFTSAQSNGLLQGYVRYGLNSYLSPTAEILLANNYTNLGLQVNFNHELGSLNFNTLFSSIREPLETRRGYAQGITYGAPIWKALSLSAGLNSQSQHYISPSSALNLAPGQVTTDSFKNSQYISLGVGGSEWGSMSLSTVRSSSWLQAGISQQYRLGYSNYWRQVGFYTSLDRSISPDGLTVVDGFSISASIPLNFSGGNSRVQVGSTQTSNSSALQSVAVSGSLLDNQLGYNLNHSTSSGASNDSGSLSVQHPWGYVSGSLSSGRGIQQTGINLGGGLVVHSQGVILSPVLGQTFAIVEIPKGEGASVQGSKARVNKDGFGVVPNLSAYYQNDVQISLEGASTEVEIDNATQKVAPVDGSIVRLKFNSTSGRPLLITFLVEKETRVPIGATISDSEGKELGTVGQGNRGLIRVSKLKDRIKVVWGDKADETCFTNYAVDDKASTNASGFVHLKLRCELSLLSEKTAQQSNVNSKGTAK